MDPAAVAQLAQLGLDLSVSFPLEQTPSLIPLATGLLSRCPVSRSSVTKITLDTRLQHYYHAATTILFYDYVLTFGDEVGPTLSIRWFIRSI